MVKTKTKVTFARSVWDELSKDGYYREVIEAIEDREALRKAKKNTDGFISFREYDENRKLNKNV